MQLVITVLVALVTTATIALHLIQHIVKSFTRIYFIVLLIGILAVQNRYQHPYIYQISGGDVSAVVISIDHRE